jgi:lipoprotein-anchoring transpeptidase ErfK/SrfK
MRRICIAAMIAVALATAISSTAVAQSLRPSYSADGISQTRRAVLVKRGMAHAGKPALLAPMPKNEAAPAQETASQSAAARPIPGMNDFFATIFAAPIMLARAFRPLEPQRDGVAPANPSSAYPLQAYAAPVQNDAGDYSTDPKFLRQMVIYGGHEAPGTIVVDTTSKFLYLVADGGKALRYGIGVGRPGFLWSGVKTVTAKREWPDWRPPAEMIARRPDLPRFMPGGVDNPLGARALYLGSSLYRIHGSNEPSTIGTNMSSGCIRMRNEDVTDLYQRVKIGTKVVVI